jgi:hypothetical protein
MSKSLSRRRKRRDGFFLKQREIDQDLRALRARVGRDRRIVFAVAINYKSLMVASEGNKKCTHLLQVFSRIERDESLEGEPSTTWKS